jgi:hypothetical protein
MIFPAPQSICENAAPAAHRIDLLLGRPNRQFLTVSLDKDPEDRHHPINGEARGAAEAQESRMPRAILRPLHRCATAGHNTFRKGTSTHARAG